MSLLVFSFDQKEKGKGRLKLLESLRRGRRGSIWRCALHFGGRLLSKVHNIQAGTLPGCYEPYLKQRRERGHVEPKVIPGRPARKGAVLQAHLLAPLEAHPDARREEHCQMFETTYGLKVSTASISRARMALG